AEEVVLLTQICPKCERAWPEQERVCDHCGTALGEEAVATAPVPSVIQAIPTLQPAEPPATSEPQLQPAQSPKPGGLRLGGARSTIPSLGRPTSDAPGVPPPIVAPPAVASGTAATIPPPDPGTDQYRCMSPNCGGIWHENQLRKQSLGRRS